MAHRISLTQSTDPLVLAALSSMTKDVMGDLVIDLLRQLNGDENLDGEDLAAAIETAHEPVWFARTGS